MIHTRLIKQASYLMSLAVLFAASAPAAESHEQLIFPKIRVHRQGTGVGIVVYRGSGDTIAGFQFDLHYDTESLKVTPSLAPSATNAGKTLSFNVLEDGTLRVLVVGFNETLIGDGD